MSVTRVQQPRAALDAHVRADHAERADFDIVVDLRGRVDRCGFSNAGCHH